MHVSKIPTVNGLIAAARLVQAERERLAQVFSLSRPDAFLSVSMVATSGPHGNVPVTVNAPMRLQEFVKVGLPGTHDAFGSAAWIEFRDEVAAVCDRFLGAQADAIDDRLRELGVVLDAGPRSVPAAVQDDDGTSRSQPDPDLIAPIGPDAADSRHGGAG